MELGGHPLDGEAFFIGVTGAQGVGKSTFCRALSSQLAGRRRVRLIDGLGDRLKAAGVPLGRHSDKATIAAVFAAHRDREAAAGGGLIILDRCVVDALAYTRVLGISDPSGLAHYEAETRAAARRLGLVIHLRLSPKFAAAGSASHETPEIRSGTAEQVICVIHELGLPHVTLDAADPGAVEEGAGAVIAAIKI